MRCTFFAIWHWLMLPYLLLSANSVDAATIEGDVVDSAGEPVHLEHPPR